MKLSDIKHILRPDILTWIFPLLLIVPNIALCFTEHYGAAPSLANALMPAGIYLLLCSCSVNIGRTVLLCTPLSIYAAFQIVLLFLYGESIIAIDMFLNVATTNFGEATELLANLGTAICAVVILYLPPIVWSVILVTKHARASRLAIRKARLCGVAISVLGLCAIGMSYIGSEGYSVRRGIFPLNVADNTFQAINRYHATKAYPATSAPFTYSASSIHPDSEREVYVLIIGETCRADNWQLLGYSRNTTPRLSGRSDIVVFPHVLSESNTTHKSVPLLLSPLTAENFGDSIYITKSIFEAFNEAGFATAFLSNQQHNGSFIDFFSRQASHCRFIADEPMRNRYDAALLPMLQEFIASSNSEKCFIVLHTYGSHFNYRERYPENYRQFLPDDSDNASRHNREKLINAYDNSIVATDALIDETITTLEQLPDSVSAAMLFVPDHGEDIFDDGRDRFLHASPSPTYWQIHVPMVLWTSPAHRTAHPGLHDAAQANSHKNISSSRSVFDTMLSIAGINSPYARPFRAVTDSNFKEDPRVYLNDYNEGIALGCAGLHREDLDMLERKNISIR